jgi:flavin-dependent dehydrogenase
MGETVNATADSSGLAARRWDAVVIGAGPAGAIAALTLARAGRQVLLVDRAPFPRYKVCGGCLNLRALHLLRQAGLEPRIRAGGAQPLERFVLAAAGAQAAMPLPGGVALSRAALDQLLACGARDAGANVVTGIHASVTCVGEESVEVQLRASTGVTTVTARVGIVATGLATDALDRITEIHTRVAPAARVGLGTVIDAFEVDFEPGRIYMAVHPRGYAGAVRIEGGRLQVAAAVDPRFLRECGTPAAAVRRVFDSAGLPAVRELDAALWRGTPPLTRRARPVARHRLLLAGDAAGYVEPFTGEGMAWALESGRAAATHAAARAETWDSAATDAWERQYARAFALAHRRCRAIAFALRSRPAAAVAVRALRIMPPLARPFVHSFNRYAEEYSP